MDSQRAGLAGHYTNGADGTRRQRTGLRLLAVHAHPDDESSKGAATLARYAAEGVHVLVATMTGGERGDVLNAAMKRPGAGEAIAAVRREEMARAARILGVHHVFLGFVDSGLPATADPAGLPAGCFARQPIEVAAGRLIRLIRRFRPHVMITYDPQGGYPHPDHVMSHKVSLAAFEAAGDPGYACAAAPPWQPLKLYYDGDTNSPRLRAIEAESRHRGLGSPFGDWLSSTASAAGPPVTTRIRCPDYFEVRDRALRAHVSQVDPNGYWFVIPVEVQRAKWPEEEFCLARSLVQVLLPEDDLFAGIEVGSASAGQGTAVDLHDLTGQVARW